MRTQAFRNDLRGSWVIPLLFLTLSLHDAIAQRSPVSQFCRRWGHQTAIVDDKLYVDGGLVTWALPSQPDNLTNTNFLYHDLTSAGNSGVPPPYANLSKNSSVPSVNGGVLWADSVNKRVYLFGGEFFKETPWDSGLWVYDILNNYWDNLGVPVSPEVRRLSYGAGLSISSRGEGYYYGGWRSNATDPNWKNAPAASSTILRYNMDEQSWDEIDGPDNIGRAEGVMNYIPAGNGGMIVYLGGIRGKGNGTWEAQPMDEIILYDVVSTKFYTQNATGDIPQNRRRFCAGAAWADDRSSYNIYLYGGLGEEEGSLGFDDVYILTMPTFTWIRMWPAQLEEQNPHHSLSCNVVHGSQMIIHGGFFPKDNKCDYPDQWGLHNLDMGEQNQDKSPWAAYAPNKTTYAVPDNVLKVVGGGSRGGATKTSPKDGYDQPDLEVLMPRTATIADRKPTRAIPGTGNDADDDESGGLSRRAIGGIVAGGVALLVGVGACFYLVRRRRHKRKDKDSGSMTHHHQYHTPLQPSGSSNQFSQGPWSPSSHLTPVSPPPFTPGQQTIQPHSGPPVELPTNTASEMVGSPAPSDAGSPREPKFDTQGNVRYPHISMTQIAGTQPQQLDGGGNESTNPSQSQHPSSPMTMNGDDPTRTRSPQELDHEVEARPRGTAGQGSPTHLTYYHP